MGKTIICTTTYRRPELLKQLGQSIELQRNGSVHWLVYNDGSGDMYKDFERELPEWVTYIKAKDNNGKWGYWKTIDYIFKWLRVQEFERVIFLPDDCVLATNGLENILRDVGNEQIFSIHNDLPHRLITNNWGHTPTDEGDYYGNGYIDMLFVASRRWFELMEWFVMPIPESRWANNKSASSGVGKQLTYRTYFHYRDIKIGKGKYIIRDHGKLSQMNPMARRERLKK